MKRSLSFIIPMSLVAATFAMPTHAENGCTYSPPYIIGDDQANDCRGTPGDDSVEMNAGPDIFLGAGGDDSVAGNEGDDMLSGQAGNDYISGERGADILRGGAGSDTLVDAATWRDVDAVCDGDGVDQVELADGDGKDIFYRASDGLDDMANLDDGDIVVSGSGCPSE